MSASLNYVDGWSLTGYLPSIASAYTALDSPCPEIPFVVAVESAISECNVSSQRRGLPTGDFDGNLKCACETHSAAVIAAIGVPAEPTICGKGPLASLAIASATQAVRDACEYERNYKPPLLITPGATGCGTAFPDCKSSPSPLKVKVCHADLPVEATCEDARQDGLTGKQRTAVICSSVFGIIFLTAVIACCTNCCRAGKKKRSATTESVGRGEEHNLPEWETGQVDLARESPPALGSGSLTSLHDSPPPYHP